MAVLSCYLSLGEYASQPMPGLDSEFDVHYTVLTDSKTYTAAGLYATGCLPARWTSHPDNIFATVRAIKLHRDVKDPSTWRAVVHYSSVPLTHQEQQWALYSNPCDRPVEIEWETTAYQTPVVCDIDGNAIINSAGEQPDQVSEKTDYYLTASVMKNVTAVPSWVAEYSGKCNKYAFMLGALPVAAECARMGSIRVSAGQQEGNTAFVKLSMQLELRVRRTVSTSPPWPAPGIGIEGANMPKTYLFSAYAPPPFYLELADMGIHKRTVTGLLPILTDADGTNPPRPVGQPVMLNGLGNKLTSPTMANARFMAYKLYETRDFSVLPLA